MAESKQSLRTILTGTFRPYAQILQSRRYRPLWFGQVVSNLGDTFHYIALVVLLFRLTGSGSALAVLALAQIAVTLAVGPVAGVIIDRFDRRIVMIAADLARAALTIGLAFTAHAPLAIILAVAMAAAGVAFNPAARALLPALVEEDALLAANAVGWTTEQATQILASAGAGALLLAYGTTPAFLSNAGTFIFSALMLLRLPARLRPEEDEEPGRIAWFWADGAAEHLDGTMTGLAHDVPLLRPARCSGRRQARPQRMPCVLRWVEARRLCSPFDDERDRLIPQPGVPHLPMPIYRAEHRPIIERGHIHLGPHRHRWVGQRVPPEGDALRDHASRSIGDGGAAALHPRAWSPPSRCGNARRMFAALRVRAVSAGAYPLAFALPLAPPITLTSPVKVRAALIRQDAEEHDGNRTDRTSRDPGDVRE